VQVLRHEVCGEVGCEAALLSAEVAADDITVHTCKTAARDEQVAQLRHVGLLLSAMDI